MEGKIIPGHERYRVTEDGRVYSYITNKWLKPTLGKNGYLSVHVDGKARYTHRLVMLAHTGPSDLMVNHKDGVTTNNQLSNLEYCIRSENQIHAKEQLGVVYGQRGVYKYSDNFVQWVQEHLNVLSIAEIARIVGQPPTRLYQLKHRRIGTKKHLTWDEVDIIRELMLTHPMKKLSKMLDIPYQTLVDIKRYKSFNPQVRPKPLYHIQNVLIQGGTTIVDGNEYSTSKRAK